MVYGVLYAFKGLRRSRYCLDLQSARSHGPQYPYIESISSTGSIILGTLGGPRFYPQPPTKACGCHAFFSSEARLSCLKPSHKEWTDRFRAVV